jgi:DNA polymerase-3 subunit epsilon
VDGSRLVALFAAAGVATASALAIRGWIKRPLKRLQSHTEFTPLKGYESGKSGANASSFLPAQPSPSAAADAARQAGQDAFVASEANVLSLIRQARSGLQKSAREITIEYRKASGEISERFVMAYSRNLVEARTHSINCRQQGERITKLYLLSGIQSLTVNVNDQSITVRSTAEIETLIDELIPEKGQASESRPAEGKANRQIANELSTAPKAEPSTDFARRLPQPPPPPPLPAGFASPVQREKTLADLLPASAKGFAVLDLETTGRESGSCRIVEIALIRLDAAGRVTEEWETLINPGCSFDNHTIHGVSEEMAAAAPAFATIAPLLAAKLDGHVLVAHNLHRFDGPILDRHFKEVDAISIDLGGGIDTMPNPRRKLSALCDVHGVSYDPNDCHTALGDVRALAQLVPKLLQDLSPTSKHVVCASNPLLSNQSSQGFTRSQAIASGCGAAARAITSQATPPQPSGLGEWRATAITLQPGLVFVGTQNKAPSKLAVLQQAEDHLLALGLKLMVKRARIIASDKPAFVVAPSLEVSSTKMKDAIRLQVPVVLCGDARAVQAGGSLKAWVKAWLKDG